MMTGNEDEGRTEKEDRKGGRGKKRRMRKEKEG